MTAFKDTKEKIRQFFFLVNYPTGADPEYDEECNSAFLKFLDCVYYAMVACYVVFAAFSSYFFVTHALM